MMPRAVSRANLFVKLRKHRIDFDKVHRFNAVNSIVIVIAKQTSTHQKHSEYKPHKVNRKHRPTFFLTTFTKLLIQFSKIIQLYLPYISLFLDLTGTLVSLEIYKKASGSSGTNSGGFRIDGSNTFPYL